MISSKKLAHFVEKWQRIVAAAEQQTSGTDGCCSTTSMEGHCVIYSADGTRFEVPLVYLGTTVFAELLRMSQEESGFTSYGKITLPCNASPIEYLIYLLRREVSEEVERAFLSSIVRPCLRGSMGLNQQFAVCI